METSTKKAFPSSGSPDIRQPGSILNVWSFAVAAVLAVFYLATSIYISSHRLFWYDEIVTYNIAKLPDYATIWRAITHAVDGGSPVYDVLVRVTYQLFGESDVVARLPSALALVAGMLIVYDCARRLTDGLHGLIALSILTCSFLPYYGHEARAYAIYFMLAALSLWIWVHSRDDRRSSAVLFGAVIFVAVSMHYYAILCLVPYALWEISRWKPWLPPSLKLIAGVLGGTVALALLSPAIRSFAPVMAAWNPWTPTSLDRLMGFFPTVFADGLWLLAMIAVWVALAETKDYEIDLSPMQPGETLGWLFLCIPLAGFVVAELETNGFAGRYFIGLLPGVAVGFSCLFWRHFRQAWRVSLGVFLLLATYGVTKQVMATRHPEIYYSSPIRHILSMESAFRNDGKQFFVLCNQSRYVEARHYSRHPEQYALLRSMDYGDPRLLGAMARYSPMQFWTLEDLRKHAQETALIGPSTDNLDILKQAGFQTEVRFSDPMEVVYLK